MEGILIVFHGENGPHKRTYPCIRVVFITKVPDSRTIVTVGTSTAEGDEDAD